MPKKSKNNTNKINSNLDNLKYDYNKLINADKDDLEKELTITFNYLCDLCDKNEENNDNLTEFLLSDRIQKINNKKINFIITGCFICLLKINCVNDDDIIKILIFVTNNLKENECRKKENKEMLLKMVKNMNGFINCELLISNDKENKECICDFIECLYNLINDEKDDISINIKYALSKIFDDFYVIPENIVIMVINNLYNVINNNYSILNIITDIMEEILNKHCDGIICLISDILDDKIDIKGDV